MHTNLQFAEASTFATPMLAVFAVDIAVGKDAQPIPVLLSTSDPVTEPVAKLLAAGEFKAGLCETLLVHLLDRRRFCFLVRACHLDHLQPIQAIQVLRALRQA